MPSPLVKLRRVVEYPISFCKGMRAIIFEAPTYCTSACLFVHISVIMSLSYSWCADTSTTIIGSNRIGLADSITYITAVDTALRIKDALVRRLWNTPSVIRIFVLISGNPSSAPRDKQSYNVYSKTSISSSWSFLMGAMSSSSRSSVNLHFFYGSKVAVPVIAERVSP